MPASLTSILRRLNYGTGSKTAYTGTAGQASVPPDTKVVIVWTTTDAFVRVGGVATANDLPLPAGIMAQIPVDNPNGGPITVSAIRDTADGSFYCIAATE